MLPPLSRSAHQIGSQRRRGLLCRRVGCVAVHNSGRDGPAPWLPSRCGRRCCCSKRRHNLGSRVGASGCGSGIRRTISRSCINISSQPLAQALERTHRSRSSRCIVLVLLRGARVMVRVHLGVDAADVDCELASPLQCMRCLLLLPFRQLVVDYDAIVGDPVVAAAASICAWWPSPQLHSAAAPRAQWLSPLCTCSLPRWWPVSGSLVRRGGVKHNHRGFLLTPPIRRMRIGCCSLRAGGSRIRLPPIEAGLSRHRGGRGSEQGRHSRTGRCPGGCGGAARAPSALGRLACSTEHTRRVTCTAWQVHPATERHNAPAAARRTPQAPFAAALRRARAHPRCFSSARRRRRHQGRRWRPARQLCWPVSIRAGGVRGVARTPRGPGSAGSTRLLADQLCKGVAHNWAVRRGRGGRCQPRQVKEGVLAARRTRPPARAFKRVFRQRAAGLVWVEHLGQLGGRSGAGSLVRARRRGHSTCLAGGRACL